jgi:uncharacterized protein YfbU (UPF0304 family)
LQGADLGGIEVSQAHAAEVRYPSATGGSETMKLTPIERAILANQYQLLEIVVPAEADAYRGARLALQRGFEADYRLVEIDSDELSEKDCDEVHQILRMYRTIDASIEALPEVPPELVGQLKFRGFDGNEETGQYAYLCYYVEDLGRYSELRGTELNSHSPSLDIYRRMLRAMGEPPMANLTLSELQGIAAARAWQRER